MDPSAALWGLCFLISAFVLFFMGQYGLCLFTLFMLVAGLAFANK